MLGAKAYTLAESCSEVQRMTEANRGKVAEAKLQKAFTKIEAGRHDFCFERIYDARSSMGKMANPRVGDFVLYVAGKNIIIECKEVAHDYRLSRQNFDRSQRARLKKRQLAGSICVILVYHSTTDLWRMCDLDYFGVEETGSWDFRATDALIFEEMMNLIMEK
jgi:penicillin-binding protein-related factor A (putative recombinase)